MNKKNKVENIINGSIDTEEKKYISLYLENLDEEEKQIRSSIDHDYSKIRTYINIICMATSLNFTIDNNELKFYTTDKTTFYMTIKDGKVNYCRKTGFNLLYFEIIEKYKKDIDELAVNYKIICPNLGKLKIIDNKRSILNGKNIYDAFLEEKKYDNELKDFIKNSNKKIEKIKEKIYSKSGWYYLGSERFGIVDVDKNIINAVILTDKWRPYSLDNIEKKKEDNFILENAESLNEYKTEKIILRNKLLKKDSIASRIENEINIRHELVEEFKNEFENKEKIKQKVI